MNNIHKRMLKVIETIDKRIGYFECIDGKFFFSDCIPELICADSEKRDKILSDPDIFIEYLSDTAMGVKSDESGAEHCFGIIDDNERYVMLHFFNCKNGIYGYAVDKTAEVYKVSKVNAELSELKKRSETDPLTGLANRNGFESVVKKALSMSPNRGALIIMDMDNFKLVNDMLGHPEGDKVLKQFASIITDYYKEHNAVIGRIGGDEFVVFLTESISKENLGELLGGFIEKVRSSYAEKYPNQKLSSSVGAVIVEAGINDYASLYKSADNALYIVKENGKGHYHIS